MKKVRKTYLVYVAIFLGLLTTELLGIVHFSLILQPLFIVFLLGILFTQVALPSHELSSMRDVELLAKDQSSVKRISLKQFLLLLLLWFIYLLVIYLVRG